MTLNEFSDAFDIKLASYYIPTNIGESNKLSFDEYEKSVFLSQAQEEIVLELYSGRNDKGISFESSEEARRLLHNLVKNFSTIKSGNSVEIELLKSLELKDLWFIVYEKCTIVNMTSGGTDFETPVIPVKYDYLHEILNNPFRGPSERRVLRIDSPEGKIKLFAAAGYNIAKYEMTYLKKPYPIILSNFEGLKVNGETASKECEIDSSLHSSIVDRAVALALKSRALLLNNNKQ